eukprot:737196-Heterocapsa_arctica.AAC.1
MVELHSEAQVVVGRVQAVGDELFTASPSRLSSCSAIRLLMARQRRLCARYLGHSGGGRLA